MSHVDRGSAHFPIAVFVMATALGPSGQSCAGDSGSGPVPSRDAGGPQGGGVVADAGPSTGADADASLDATASTGDDASSPAEPPDTGLPDASAAAAPPAGDGGPGAVWATWPMPNAPSSGLPRPQTYDTSIEGTALDKVTALMWQRSQTVLSTADSVDAETILPATSSACTALELGGFHDWRVPTRIELVSLMDFTAFPAENTAVFSAQRAFFLSSSRRSIALGTEIGTVWFGDGTDSTSGGAVYMTSSFMGQLQGPVAVRCVRGGLQGTGPHYTVAGGTVRDNWTGLTWQQNPSTSSMEPSSVISYCAGQTMAGGGWRAPSVNELETLWGDFYNPDSVGMDPSVFPVSYKLGSSNVYVSSTGISNPEEWISVGNGLTNAQADVPPSLFTLSGFEPYYEYWSYAQCVR
jgi:hypothetical protein